MINRIADIFKRAISLIALRPFDISTPEGRAQERHRRVALSTLASVAAKSISVGTALISIPLALHYLGTERYGMWMTMSSLVAMLSFADLGIGNGIVNAVATAHGKNNPTAIREYVSSSFFVLTLIALAIMALFVTAYPFTPWYRVFNVMTPQARSDSGPALAALVGCFALTIPFSIVHRVQMGMQNGFMASLWQCAGSLLGLAGVVTAITLQASLALLVLAFAGRATCRSDGERHWSSSGIQQPEIAPRPSFVSRQAIRRIAHIGVLFFVLQVVGALAYSSDNVIIAQILGAAAVPQYSVPEKIFSTMSTIFTMILIPIWPAYSEAIAREDHAWVNKTLKRSLLMITSLAMFFSTILVVAGPWLIWAWVGGAIVPSFMLLLGLGLWKVVEAAGNALSVYLNGAHIFGTQIIISSATLVCAVGLKIVLVRHFGVAGAVWATLTAFSVCALIPYSILIYIHVTRKSTTLFGSRMA